MPEPVVGPGLEVSRYLARARLRGGWRFVLGAALIAGMAGGVSLAALAGARRTDSVFDRLADATRAGDVLVLPNSSDAVQAVTPERLRAIAGVEQVAGIYGVLGVTADGAPIDSAMLAPIDDGINNTIERPIVREGRLPRPDAVDELFATPAGQQDLGVAVGETVDLTLLPDVHYDTDQTMVESMFAEGRVLTRTFRLVGVGFRIEEANQRGSASVFFTHAFYEQTHAGPLYVGYAVHLDDSSPAGIAAFQAAVTAMALGAPVQFQTTSASRDAIERPLRPQVIALTAFSIVTVLAALTSWAQAIARRHQVEQQDARILSMLGLSSRARRRSSQLFVLVIASVAAVVAVVTSALLSALFPRGDARRIEPDRGFAIDGLVVFGGAVVFGFIVFAIGAGVTARGSRSRAASTTAHASGIVRRVVERPAMSTGVSHALDVDRGLTNVPVRSTLVGAVVGLTAIAATITFSSSLTRFVDTPRQFGWGYDLTLDVGDVDDEDASQIAATVDAALQSDGDVRGWGSAATAQVLVDDRNETVMGVAQGGGETVGPTLLAGRLPVAANEIALGRRTARQLEASIGDQVQVGTLGAQHTFDVVGMVVLPGLGNNSTDRAALGGGAVLDLDGLAAALALSVDDFVDAVRVVDVRDGASPAGFVARLRATLATSGLADGLVATGPDVPALADRPVASSEVLGYRSIRTTPVVLAGVLALLSAGGIAHALIVSVRRRRRELGTLQALGFTPSQVRWVVRWQATTIALVALAVGLPAGVIIGRQAWRAVATQMGVVNHPLVPWAATAVVAVGALIIVNLVAVLPGRSATHVVPAQALRDE